MSWPTTYSLGMVISEWQMATREWVVPVHCATENNNYFIFCEQQRAVDKAPITAFENKKMSLRKEHVCVHHPAEWKIRPLATKERVWRRWESGWRVTVKWICFSFTFSPREFFSNDTIFSVRSRCSWKRKITHRHWSESVDAMRNVNMNVNPHIRAAHKFSQISSKVNSCVYLWFIVCATRSEWMSRILPRTSHEFHTLQAE